MSPRWGVGFLHPFFMKKRTHDCGELRPDAAGSTVVLAGWIDSIRDHGGVLFLDLRDREGKTQVVLHPGDRSVDEALARFKPESVIEVEGKVLLREEGTVNPKMATGEVEVHAAQVSGDTWNRVLVGEAESGKEANALIPRLKEAGYRDMLLMEVE